MARKLVEFDDVAAAAQKLKDAGKRPTVIAIRDIIGKGSFTTISTYLKQWSEEHSLDEELVEVVLPESVMSDAELFLQKIYTVAKASADEQLERERELLRQKEIEYQEDMQQAVDMANDATERAERHCCKVSDEAAFCLIQRPYISKTLLTRRISPRGSP
ncbi:hypothetical protein HEC89_24320 (plasmid) [Salmonella enterica subsp. enterica serovar Typhimurium]|nr:hypothetical protein HEC89_24320 [Salmonella enterica subsp. enterica serovar Typhimurium]WIW82378.1 hypothetical protein FOHJFLPL_00032 [Salmonella enterica subsp. enterica serovar Typhimurium]